MKNKAAQELAQKRHLSLTPERRSEIAKKAASVRWCKDLSPVAEEDIDNTDTLR